MRIDEMRAGKEMDALVAEKVLNYSLTGDKYIILDIGIGERGGVKAVPNYSTDIAEAWEVVEKITEKHWKFKLRRLPGKDYMAYFQNLLSFPTESESAPSKSAPLAICRAALKAVLGRDKI